MFKVRVRACVFVVCFALIGTPAFLHAETQASITIPAGELNAALESLVEQTGVQLLYDLKHVKGLRTRGVSNAQSAQAAVAALLEGTGLIIKTDASGAILIAESAAAGGGTTDLREHIDEVIVTAQKREQSLTSIPTAVVALGGDRLREAGAKDLVDMSQLVPGVVVSPQAFGGRTMQSFTIRGIGFDDFRPNGNPSAAVHSDGIYQGSTALVGGQMFDVERIEILKGPQGTLYGRNTTAGAVNVISRKPTDTYSGFANLEYGRFNAWRIEGAAGGPLSDRVAIRGAVVFDESDGFMTNLGPGAMTGRTPHPAVPPITDPGRDSKAGRSEFHAGRAIVQFTPGDDARILFNIHGFEEGGAAAQLERTRTSLGSPPNLPYTTDSEMGPYLDKSSYGASTTLELGLTDSILLTFLGGYDRVDQEFNYADGEPTRRSDALYRDRVKQGFAEARLQSRNRQTFNWIAGASFFSDSVFLNPLLYPVETLRTNLVTPSDQTRESWAVFGDGSWMLSPGWEVSAGLRYTYEQSDFSGSTIDLDPYGVSIAGRSFSEPLPISWDNHYSEGEVSGRVALRYEFNTDASVYLSINRGFKAGGFDGSTIFSQAEALPFDSETVWAYEAGMKFLPREGFVQIEASGFYYDFSGLQANAIVEVIPGISTSSIRTNVGKSRVYGLDTSVTVHPAKGLTVTANIALVDSRITEIVSDDPAEAARRLNGELPLRRMSPSAA